MIKVLHIAAECYPAAKTGGLADVVGALPKYLTKAGVESAAIIPKYGLKWFYTQEWTTVHTGVIRVDWRTVHFSIQRMDGDKLGFPFFVVNVPGLFDRNGIYHDQDGRPFGDEAERYLVFQQAVLQWLTHFQPVMRPRVLHCHDHHTGMIPFMVKHCPEYQELASIPTVFTIHNGQYQGWMSWNQKHLLPFYEARAQGLLDWKQTINPMASALRCAWKVTTVSESYLYELHQDCVGLEPLFRQEYRKETGIVNGIDADVWDPATDSYVQHLYKGDVKKFKQKNKEALCKWFNLPNQVPLVSFIGRLVHEKGSDLLPEVFKRYIHLGGNMSFLVLGSGDSHTENEFKAMAHHYPSRFNCYIGYNEELAHQVYAGSDFLVMPSRVEPCGLNQMYSMRYGTVPIVRSVGGLKDTVPDIGEPNGQGRGIRFDRFLAEDLFHGLYRAGETFQNADYMHQLRKHIMQYDSSWEKSVHQYLQVYKSLFQAN